MCGKVLWMFLISQRDAFISLSQKDFASLISHRKHWTNPHPPCSSNRYLGWRVENGYMHGDNPLDLGLNIHNSCHLHPFTNFSSGTAQVIHTFPAPSCWDWWDAIWIRPQSSAGDAIQQTHAKQQQNGLRISSVHLHKLGQAGIWFPHNYGCIYLLSSLGTLVLFLWVSRTLSHFANGCNYTIYIYIHTHLRYTKHQPTRLCFFKMYPKCPGAHPRCFEPLYNFMVVVSILRVHTLK